MYNVKKLILGMILVSFHNVGFSNTIRLGQPNILGNGCLLGTVVAAVAADKSAITVIFSDFIAQAGMENRKGVEIKSCNMSLPIFAPLGYRLKFIGVDLRGYVSLEGDRAKAKLKTRYHIPGHLPFEHNREFSGDFNDDFIFRTQLTKEVWTICSGATHLSLRTELRVEANPFGGEALAAIDSIDTYGEPIKFNYKLEKCF